MGDITYWLDLMAADVPTSDHAQSIEREGEPPLLSGHVLPFRFEYGGRDSDTLLPMWERSVRVEDAEPGERRVVMWDDPATGLRVEWSSIEYDGRNAVELGLAFENRGRTPSEVLTRCLAMRHVYESPVDLIHAVGGVSHDPMGTDGTQLPNYRPSIDRLSSDGASIGMRARDGWSSNVDLPFWLILGPSGTGLYYGLGCVRTGDIGNRCMRTWVTLSTSGMISLYFEGGVHAVDGRDKDVLSTTVR